MSKEHFSAIIHQFEHLCAQIDPTADFSHRYMFGGVGLYTRGSIFGTLMGLGDETVSIALKLPVDGREPLNKTGELIPEPPGGKQYATLPPRIAGDEDRLMEWLERSLIYTHTLAVKKKK